MSTSAFSVISIDTFDFKLKKYKLVFNYLHPNESLKATLPSVLVTMAVEQITPKFHGLKQENFMVSYKKTFILPQTGQALEGVAYFCCVQC